MVNAVNGHGYGHHVGAYSQTSQPTPDGENTEVVQEQVHPGKKNAGAPGQMAKQMLDGAPPAGFALGSLVSLIAQGDMEGAQNLVNSLTPPPPVPAEEPALGDEVADLAVAPESLEAVTTASSAVETVVEVTETTEMVEGAGVVAQDAIDLSAGSSDETTILDLFDSLAGGEETV